ncbi:MAG: hypothetical protein NC102_03870 [Clostridium sp.]|nr:hypothetical protein [Clostridium sp.]
MATEVNYARVLGYLMKSWTVRFGALSLLCVAGYWVHPLWMPLLAFAALAVMHIYNNFNSRKGASFCPLFSVATNYSIFIAFAAMVVINLINSKWLIYTSFGGKYANPEIPFISTLVVYPSMVVGYAYALIFRGNSGMCDACRESAGYSIKDTLERNVFHHEVKFQMRMAFFLSLTLAVVTWAYYFLFYINVNINTPDAFYFFVVPGLVYLFSLVYFYMKYSSLDFEIKMMSSQAADEKFHTLEHFMVVRGDKLLLQELQVDGIGIGLWDSPAVYKRSYEQNVSDETARKDFSSLSGLDEFTLKSLFVTTTDKQNCFHYAAFIGEEEEQTKLSGKWCTLLDVDRLIKAGKITRPLAYELHRVYTMTMAWKTYDREGKRLYAIRNYRPTFKLIDFKNWDLDYNDLHWLAVAQNNEDKRFFRLRKFWRHYVGGADWLWKKRN